jgi:uncharacterized protein CbrC (UPF0167 family)
LCDFDVGSIKIREVVNVIVKYVGGTAGIGYDDSVTFQLCVHVTVCSWCYCPGSAAKTFLVKVSADITNYDALGASDAGWQEPRK